MDDDKWFDPFEAPPNEVVSSRLATRDARYMVALGHAENEKLKRHCDFLFLTVPEVLLAIVEDFVNGLPETPNNP